MVTTGGIIFCACAALCGGFIDAISGGGGLLTLPALLLTGVPPHVALGTNKVGACMGTTVALVNYSLHRLVRWRLVAFGIAFSLGGSYCGAILALHIEQELLAKILIFLLPFAMLITFLPHRNELIAPPPQNGMLFLLVLPIVCFIIGAYDGFFGPATGSFLILALHWILRLGLVEASATTKAFNLASNISGALSFIYHGAVLWSLALIMGVCLMAGNWLGSAVAIHVGAKVVRRFLIVSLLLLLVTLIWQYFVAPT